MASKVGGQKTFKKVGHHLCTFPYPRKILGGQLTGVTTGTPVAEATQCLTDTFTITNQENLPVICGINSGYHVYFGKFDLCLFLTTCYFFHEMQCTF